jgi:succinyl-CoA synthetase alpha subunit
MAKHSDVDCVVNFASSRSVYSSTMELLQVPQIKSIAIIAEGVPERRAREILHVAKKKGVTIIGPATVGGIKPGAFKIGNTGGMMDNIVASKLYRKGSVGYVSKSGGMSNELNNLVANYTDGVYEGVAIGGDRYPGTTFIDHMLRYQADPDCKILLLLGEVGGIEEYRVIEAVKAGVITKPIVAWAIGTVAGMLKTEVQFGHAGSMANSELETAVTKNKSMREAGFFVPNTFEELPEMLATVYQKLVKAGSIVPKSEPAVPKIPIDYSWAQELGLIRKPAAFISTISDDRGQELLYAGLPISDVFRDNIGIGGVMSLLWFRRRLPDYASKFLEMVLMLTADHGPAVSGAMNTIITTRAGKDLISALVAGLLTIGSRFGGALDGAAEEFTRAFDKGLSPRDFVDTMRKENKLSKNSPAEDYHQMLTMYSSWYWSPCQVSQQPRSPCFSRKGVLPGQLPEHQAPRLRTRRRICHNLEEGQPHSQRRRLCRRLLRRSSSKLWRLQQRGGRGLPQDGSSQRSVRARTLDWSDCPLPRPEETAYWSVQTSLGRHHLSASRVGQGWSW